MFCTHCGKQIDDSANFCCFCGAAADSASKKTLTDSAVEKAIGTLDLDEVIRYLRYDFPIRTVKEGLEKAISEKANELAASPDEYEAKRRELESVLRMNCGDVNVRNWLSGRANSISRDSALKIAFALRMREVEAERFLLQSCCLNGFYPRDFKDAVYKWCLTKKIDFEQAKSIIEKLPELDISNTDIEANLPPGEKRSVTEILDDGLGDVGTRDELIAYIKQNKGLFGSFRRKPYAKFMELYSIKKRETAPEYSAEEMSGLISMGFQNLKGRQSIMNVVFKKIAENPLSRTALSEITSKTPIQREGHAARHITEVSRKHLILVWLLVNGGNPHIERGTEDVSLKNAFGETKAIIDGDILEPCGMPLLDPRNPFDWIILNSLHYAYYSNDPDDPDVVERINALMDELAKRLGERGMKKDEGREEGGRRK